MKGNIMDRIQITRFLSERLIVDKLSGRGKYYAKEVSLDYGTSDVKRIDFLQFEPAGVVYQSDIEKGIFICYEVKSCKADVFSGNGVNFIGEKNYIVTTMECYKSIIPDINNGNLRKHIKECCPAWNGHVGIIVPIPWGSAKEDEFEDPTPLTADVKWEMKVVLPCNVGGRKRSTTELLFCMLRSGQ